jgi:EAL domain-containing protein (putative c-di-GMP-specific phosphodiesterase class I)
VEQLDLLKAFGCDLAQGFHFSKPVASAEFTELLAKKRSFAV